MSKPDNTQRLDGILNDIVAVTITLEGEPLDKALNVQKQALLDWRNKQVEAVLDRLYEEQKGFIYDHTELKLGYATYLLSAIEAERNKLKESSDD